MPDGRILTAWSVSVANRILAVKPADACLTKRSAPESVDTAESASYRALGDEESKENAKATPARRPREQGPRSSTTRTSPTPSLRKRHILNRAARLMQHKGYDGISAQQIADALEFSKANFFYHVKTKE